MAAGAFLPIALGLTIDRGMLDRNASELIRWSLVVLGLTVLRALTATIQERADVATRLDASYRVLAWINDKVAEIGRDFHQRVGAGEVVNIGAGDTASIGAAMAATSRAAGGLLAVAIVSVVMLSSAWQLGLVVLLGVPIILRLLKSALTPLRRRQVELRELQGGLTASAADIADGLPVIKGLGVAEYFSVLYRTRSQQVRHYAVHAAVFESLVAAIRVLATALLGAVVVGFGAALTLRGEIAVGQLVAFYSYAVFLTTPLRWIIDAAEAFVRGTVSGDRVAAVLSLELDPAVTGPAGLTDCDTGVKIDTGLFTAVVCRDTDVARPLADRLVGCDHERRLESILLVPGDDYLFSGTLRDSIDPFATVPQKTIEACIRVAAFDDVVEAMPNGLETSLRAGGANLSGGQQQRLRLVRALATEPSVLILLDPTSALDAITEVEVITGLRELRQGTTTVVFTHSPLVLGYADQVLFLDRERVRGSGSHRELLATMPDYRQLVDKEVEVS